MAIHTKSSALNELNSFTLAYRSKNLNKRIQTTIHPVSPIRNEDKKYTLDSALFPCIEAIPFSNLDFVNGILVAFLISLTTICMTRERETGSKKLHFLSGTHFTVYWFANYLFDFAFHLFSSLSIVLTLKIISMISKSDNEAVILFKDPSTAFYLLIFLILSSFSWSTLAYLWSFFFKSDMIAFIVLFITLSVVNFLDMIMAYVNYFNSIISSGPCSNNETGECSKTNMARFSEIARIIFVALCPNIAVKRTVYRMKTNNSDCFGGNTPEALNIKGISNHWYFLLYNLGLFIIGNIVLYFIEDNHLFARFFQFIVKRKNYSVNYESSMNTESDVDAESERIKNADQSTIIKEEPFVVNGLYKIFGNKIAVQNLTFGVKPKECFGLLGLNGAGKTTTLKILNGEIYPTSGHTFINGHDLSRSTGLNNLSLGFCPQFDYLPDYLTVKETLYLYANIRGIRSEKIKCIVNEFIQIFKLTEFKHKLSQTLSGGNKRKLSSAIAFIGQPKTVILDEPTSGMDPAARRYLWNVIKKARDIGTTLILTTHSMEESEALCSKLGIMVNGRFQCFGNVQHLKNKYGNGYTLIIKCKQKSCIQNVKNFIEANINGTKLKDIQEETLFYHIECSSSVNDQVTLSIGYIFNLFELNKVDLGIETYSLCQTSLEQVFLFFAKNGPGSDYSNQGADIQMANDDIPLVELI